MQFWRLDGENTSFIIAAENGLPWVLYWGRTLPEDEDLTMLSAVHAQDIPGGVADRVAELSFTPSQADLFTGHPGMRLRASDGSRILPNFKVQDVEHEKNRLLFRSFYQGLILEHLIEMDSETGLLILSSRLISDEPIYIDWLAAPVLPLPASATKTTEFSGRWCKEFQEITIPLTTGMRLRDAREGRSSHENPPYLFVASSQGSFGFHYGWSGGHKMVTEELSDGRRYVQFGHSTQDNISLMTDYQTSPLYAAHGSNRMAVAQSFQNFARRHLAKPRNETRPRPVHYNCWEAIYFDHNIDALKAIADEVAKIGAERFVLDDGWFGERDDDTSSLGDWVVDKRKYPNGLSPLIDHVHTLGMSFGIWFEPEMVNAQSALYKAHPEWILGESFQPEGRTQLLLNMALKDVQEYLFEKISKILETYPIDYIKWDHNRILPIIDSQQTEGFYTLLDRLIFHHPSVDFESCSSGGGRIDYAVLKRASRVWLSDSNDALERWVMQLTASTFLPIEMQGSHVGPRECHTSGRVLPMAFRAWVAATRHMGFEMNPHELTLEEKKILSEITSWYKANREWLHKSYAFRLPQDDSARLGEIIISPDKKKFVAFIAQMESSRQTTPRPIRFIGLNMNATYRVKLINPHNSMTVSRGKVASRTQDIVLSARALCDKGVHVPLAFPATMWIIEGNMV